MTQVVDGIAKFVVLSAGDVPVAIFVHFLFLCRLRLFFRELLFFARPVTDDVQL